MLELRDERGRNAGLPLSIRSLTLADSSKPIGSSLLSLSMFLDRPFILRLALRPWRNGGMQLLTVSFATAP
jgi:hypothetical protein